MNLDLKEIIDLQVNLAARSAARKGFNVALILGKSTVIPVGERVRIYTSVSQLISDGFAQDSAEVKAARLYFAASSSPRKLAVGVMSDNDTDIVKAAEACREANNEWYILIPLGATNKQIESLAEWAETATPDTLLAYTTMDPYSVKAPENTDATSEDPNADTIEVFKHLKAKNYRRSFGQYTTHNDTPDAVAATIGYAMGQNRGLASSAFTLAYKKLPGVEVDNLSETQVQYAAGDSETAGMNGNVYVRRADAYDILQQGLMADGSHFDEILNIDMLKNEILLSIMDLLTTSPKVPHTEPGMTLIKNKINVACDKFVKTGFIAPGVWNGGVVETDTETLDNGTTLATGYRVLSDSVDGQSQADRDARKAPPIYVCIKTAGAIEFLTIAVNVNR